MKTKIPVGVIGCGWAGTVHARFYALDPHVQVVGVYDKVVRRARKLATELGLPMCSSLEELLEQKPLAVSIATEPQSHYELALRCLEEGIHVFCEKPLSRDVTEARLLCQKADEKDLLLGVNFNQRFSPLFNEIRKRLEQVTEIHFVHSSMFQSVPQVRYHWATEAFIIYDAMSHQLDTLRFLVGDVERVFAEATLRGAPVWTEVAATLVFSKGCIGTISTSFSGSAKGVDPFTRLEIVTDKEHIIVKNLVEKLSIRPHRSDSAVVRVPTVFDLRDYLGLMQLSLQAWISALREGNQPPVTGWDGLAVTYICNAIERAIRERKPQKVEHVQLREVKYG